jgi:hypothetical protein
MVKDEGEGRAAVVDLDQRLRQRVLEVFDAIDVDGSGALEPGEINGWLLDVCGWSDEQVEQSLWGQGGMWAGQAARGIDFEKFLKAVIRYHWPVGDFDHSHEMKRLNKLAAEQHKAAAQKAVEMTVQVIGASDLPIKDMFTQSADPYCIVKFNRQKEKTEVLHRTLNPKWVYKSFTFPIMDPSAPLSDMAFHLMVPAPVPLVCMACLCLLFHACACSVCVRAASVARGA